MKVYVSLTSIFQNQVELLKTLQSLLSQTLLPDAIFLYLSVEPYLMDTGFGSEKNISNSELRSYLEETKLINVKWVKNTGPFRKLLPLLEEKWKEDCVIITVDDDTYYHPKLLENYVGDYNSQKKCVINYRGFTFNGKNLDNINYSKRETPLEKSLYNFPTGKGGVLYHPKFFHKTDRLIFDESIYLDACNGADDIWFYFVRICNKVECVLKNKSYMTKDNTSSYALFRNVNIGSANTYKMRNCVKILKSKGYLI